LVESLLRIFLLFLLGAIFLLGTFSGDLLCSVFLLGTFSGDFLAYWFLLILAGERPDIGLQGLGDLFGLESALVEVELPQRSLRLLGGGVLFNR